MRDQDKVYTSRCGGETRNSTRKGLCAMYEAAGYEALRRQDAGAAQVFFQHAENYKPTKEHEQ